MPSSLLTTRLLLDSLRPSQTAEGWFSAWEATGSEWEELVEQAVATGLAAQLHRRLQSWRLALPPEAEASLSAVYQEQAQRNAAILEQLGEILDAAAAHELQPLVLKAAYLAARWYPQPALRPMSGIDLLFHPADLRRVEMMLHELGYEGQYAAPLLGAGTEQESSTFRRPLNPTTEASYTVEPYLSLAESCYSLRVDITPGTRTRSHPARFGGHEARVQATEDLLLQLCVHFSFHLMRRTPSLLHLTDLLMVIEEGDINWEVLVERARAYGAIPYTLASLIQVQRLLDATVPIGVLPDLAAATPALARRHIQELELADILERSQQPAAENEWERLRASLQAGAEAARWAPGWYARWRIGRATLDSLRS